MGFRETKAEVMQALAAGTYLNEARGNISTKNLLAMGEVSADEVREVIGKCTGTHHSSSPHHQDRSVTVHVLRHSGWYIKFYFVDPDTVFYQRASLRRNS